MRLKDFEKQAIIDAVQSNIKDPFALYLFGSRTDIHKKGGDIDLLLVVSKEDKPQLLMKKHLILGAIQLSLGEQKIDLVIATKDETQLDPFVKSIFHQCVLLA